MRNLLRAALLAVLIAPATATALGPPPTPSGTAWLLVDGQTGEVLAERNPDAARPMASTTKMMTALVALESGDLDKVVTVVPAAAGGVGESSAGLKPGQRITMHDLIRGLMIGSGNDAAIAIAYAVAGSEAEFVTRMNDKAKEMGLTSTRFANPHGLDEPGHRSSPRDLLVLGRAVVKDPFLRKIVGQRRTSIPNSDGSGRVQLESENDLLSIMPEADGVKTGHTDDAGYVLVAHATSGNLGRDFYAVVMGEPDRATRAADSQALLEWAFANYARPVVIPRGRTVVDLGVQGVPGTTVALAPPAPVAATVRVGKPVSMRVVAPSMATAPVQKGQRVGRVEVLQDGAVLARSALIARGSVDSPGFGDSLKSALSGIGSVFS